jgi:hypothetical protein
VQGDMTRPKVQGEPFIRERVGPLEFFDREVSLTMQSDGQSFREGQAVVDPETGWARITIRHMYDDELAGMTHIVGKPELDAK